MMDSNQSGDSGKELSATTEIHSPESSAFGPPVAIVGMACRFPGADDISAFWHLLETGGNAIQEGLP